DREFLGEETQHEAAHRILDEDHPLEAELAVGRKRLEQLLDRSVDRSEERNEHQQAFGPLQQAPAEDVVGEDPDQQHNRRRQQDTQAGYVVEAQPDLDTARETVGPSEEPDERHDTHHQGHDDDDARQKGAPQPLHHPRPPCHSHTNVATASRMRYQAKTSSRFVTRNLMKYFTVRYPTTADTPIPTRNRIAS